MSGRLPDFFCLGVQKGGTTTLFDLLRFHENIYLPETKELHYFTTHYDQGLLWYKTFFESCQSSQICGDFTPYYIFHPLALQRISKLLPHARLIILLRDPVARTLSHYFHSVRHGFEYLSLKQALLAEHVRLHDSYSIISAFGSHKSHQEHSYLSRSRYELQLRCLFDLFPRDQVLILRSEDLFARDYHAWTQIIAFLGIPPIPFPPLSKPSNPGSGESSDVDPIIVQSIRLQLDETYRWLSANLSIDW